MAGEVNSGGVSGLNNWAPEGASERGKPSQLEGSGFGRKISRQEDVEPHLFRGSTLMPRSHKPLRRRRVAIRQVRPLINPEQQSAHKRKRDLKTQVLNLNPVDKPAVDKWIQGMKNGLAQVAADLKSEGIKDVTMDLKLDRLFQGYHFTHQDMDLLIKLKGLNRGDNVVAHLCGKISKDIAESVGCESDSVGDRMARRNEDTRTEALAARQQFLSEASPETLAGKDIQHVLGQLVGRPFGLRPDLQALYNKLGSVKMNLSSNGGKARALRKTIKGFLEGPQKKDLVAANRLVNAVKQQLESVPSLGKSPAFHRWPDTYTELMKPEVRVK